MSLLATKACWKPHLRSMPKRGLECYVQPVVRRPRQCVKRSSGYHTVTDNGSSPTAKAELQVPDTQAGQCQKQA